MNKKHMVVVRESDVSDELLMLGMIHKTMAGCRDVPGAAQAAELGMAPLRDPGAVRGEFKRTRSHKLVLFELEGTVFLYAMGSAAKVDSDATTNDYAELLLEVLKVFRPQHLHLASITRLLRSTTFANVFEAALKEAGTLLHVEGGVPINLSDFSGRMIYQMLASFAAFERDTIVLRTTIGRIAAARRGQLIGRPDVLPLGYEVDDEGFVVPNPSKRDHVQALLAILALPNLSSRRRAELISCAGIRLPRNYGSTGSDDMADSRDPKGAMRALYKWVELYATGTYTMRHANPLPGVDMLSDTAVHRDPDNPDDPGWINLEHRWGLPEGGWADPAVFHAALAQQTERNKKLDRTGGQGHRQRKPLLGAARWIEDGTEWIMDSHSKHEYRLRCRSVAAAGPNGGWVEPSVDGKVIARVRASELHRSIATGIAEALETGVAAQRLTGSSVHDIGGRLYPTAPTAAAADAIRDQIVTARTEASRLRAAAAGLNPEDAAPWVADAVRAERRARGLEQELADYLARGEDEAPAGLAGARVDAEVCARAVAALGRIECDTHRAAADAIATILHDLRLALAGPRTLAWTVHVLLPVEGGAALLGPISGSVETVASRASAGSSSLTKGRDLATAMEVMAGGGTLPTVIEAVPTWGVPAARAALRAAYAERGLEPKIFSSLQWCQVPDLTRAVFTTLLKHPNPDPATFAKVAAELDLDDVDPAWTELVLRTYLTPDPLDIPRNWAAHSVDEQRLLDAVAAGGADGATIATLLPHSRGWNRHEITRRLLAPRPNPGLLLQPYARRGRWDLDARGGRILPTSTILPFPCPHCEGLAVRIWRAAEVPRQLLCTTCRRMPVENSPTYPEAYLLLPAGGRGQTLGWDDRAPSASRQRWRDSLDERTHAELATPCQRCGEPFVGLAARDKHCPPCRRALRGTRDGRPAATT